jgi:hypothetical protein
MLRLDIKDKEIGYKTYKFINRPLCYIYKARLST